MTTEDANYINQLDPTTPDRLKDLRKDGDDQIRLVKKASVNTFKNVISAASATTAELNYLSGATSLIGDQVASKVDIASPVITGVPTAPTSPTGTSNSNMATIDFVTATALNGALPGQLGNAGKVLSTDGTNANWTATILTPNTKPKDGVNFANTNNAQTLRNKTLVSPTFADNTNLTKRATLITSSLPIGGAVLKMPDADVQLCTPRERLIAVTNAANVKWVELDLSATQYAGFRIDAKNITTNHGYYTTLVCQLKIGGKWKVGDAVGVSDVYPADEITHYSNLSTAVTAFDTFSVSKEFPLEARGAYILPWVHSQVYTTGMYSLTSRIYAAFDTTLKATVYSEGGMFSGSNSSIRMPPALSRCEVSTPGAVTGIRFGVLPLRNNGSTTPIIANTARISGKFYLYGLRGE